MWCTSIAFDPLYMLVGQYIMGLRLSVGRRFLYIYSVYQCNLRGLVTLTPIITGLICLMTLVSCDCKCKTTASWTLMLNMELISRFRRSLFDTFTTEQLWFLYTVNKNTYNYNIEKQAKFEYILCIQWLSLNTFFTTENV